MKRGDIVSTVGRGDFSTKPRPSLIVQADSFNEHHPAFTVCPITSDLSGDSFYRVPIASTGKTGLKDDSEIEVDRIQAIWRERTRGIMGTAPEDVMLAVDRALRLWLDI